MWQRKAIAAALLLEAQRGVAGSVGNGVLSCVNDQSSYWPQCSPGQNKPGVNGPSGYEFGYYCTQEWAEALNEVLCGSVVGKCDDVEAIHKFLSQVAYETGYYSTLYQPRDGGAGLIHMIPDNWKINAADMDALWPGHNYQGKLASMGKNFFQTAEYGWRSVAAWFKKTNRVIPGCGLDLFDAPFATQTRCILGWTNDRSEAYNLVGRCLPRPAGAPAGPAPRTPVQALVAPIVAPMAVGAAQARIGNGVLSCVNDQSSYWPQCSPGQNKPGVNGPSGYEFGYYCTQEWAEALNEVLCGSVVGKCDDVEAIHKFLSQVAYETGYYSTLYQPRDGGAGLIHMIPDNWKINAADMDALWPGHNYQGKLASMGKNFFQTAEYGWRSVAAWFKKTNRVIPGCGLDLFDAPFATQTRCILGWTNDRSEAYNLVGRCLPRPAGSVPAADLQNKTEKKASSPPRFLSAQ